MISEGSREAEKLEELKRTWETWGDYDNERDGVEAVL